MDNLIIASTKKDHIRHWIDVLTAQYTVTFTNNIEPLFSIKKQNDSNLLLVLDASLINIKHQLPVLCNHVKKVIVVGENYTPDQQIQFICDGAWGYSDISINRQLILRTIEGILNNEIWLKRQLVPQMLKGIVAKQNFTERSESFDMETCKAISILSQREIEVVEHVYNGEDNLFIAKQLDITNRTVKAHLTSIFRKLHIEDRFKLVVYLKDLQFGKIAHSENLFRPIQF